MLDELLDRLKGMAPEQRKEVDRLVEQNTGHLSWIPNPGPQTRAYDSKADILLFGGEPGGGKTGLLIGLALNCHQRSLLVRKQFADVEGVIDNAKGIVGSSDGFVGGGRPKYNKPDGGVIHFQGMAGGEEFDTGKQGTPHDFIGVDEGAQLPENAIRLLLGWNRTKTAGQRCRMVIATNPPVDPVGDWMGDFFGPWLDPDHPNPAEDGELRWFVIGPEGNSLEVEGPEPVEIEGKTYYPHSRSYINSKLEDNPFIDAEEYRRRLQTMPEPYRSMLTGGNFLLARRDDDFQVIPTAWVMAAQARWTEKPPEDIPMTAIGVDVAQGGDDNTTVAPRHDWYFAKMIEVPGRQTPGGTDVAGLVISKRRDGALVVVDLGGGWGGEAYAHLKSNNVECIGYLGVKESGRLTKDNQLRFTNVRTEAYWRLREALDPDQAGGSMVALPPSKTLRADLCTPKFKVESNGIKITSKEDVKKLLGRSPDEGDAAVMSWYAGARAYAVKRKTPLRNIMHAPRKAAMSRER